MVYNKKLKKKKCFNFSSPLIAFSSPNPTLVGLKVLFSPLFCQKIYKIHKTKIVPHEKLEKEKWGQIFVLVDFKWRRKTPKVEFAFSSPLIAISSPHCQPNPLVGLGQVRLG